ncbi:MAG: UDP-N-acetylglucosamine--N-acetylmuramyl-(pentapeptide) pyrophosphoryl-undecaprenol N-acetylglucosamine transferase [bacterium]|nr:UDP-N-acetylglucosamine--N-acetylmuramyl-(pentapeptide) pyrophosphoryl-undecaprenol N-acetylglucosamine transferase [bacterium]
MKILFTGGCTGGHFYPIIAVAEKINEQAKEKRLLPPQLFFMSDSPYDQGLLFDNNIAFVKSTSGKIRRYFSLKNFFDIFTMVRGSVKAIWTVFKIYPDVVFGKGGHGSFPALFAARVLKIPVIIHESDSSPGRVNAWAAKFAERIAISYPQAAENFPKDKVAVTGNPIRQELLPRPLPGAREFLKLEEGVPVILVVGGSQGSQTVNDAVVDILPALVEKYSIIHQTGKANINEIKITTDGILDQNPHKGRYKPFGYLDDTALRMSMSAAKLVISRAGSSIFEIAAWGIPSVVIPIPENVSHDQTKNAFYFARSGGCVVIEENNLTPTILLSEIERLLNNGELYGKMAESAKSFARLDAADKIAKEILEMALKHEV